MCAMFDPAVFRMYDIRGVADRQVTRELAHGVGQVLGTRILESGGTTAAVGRDVRHSSPKLAASAAAGLAAAGLEVRDLGVVPTPVLYHALHRQDLGGGIMVTGSHNPKEDNGLKLCLGRDSLYGEAVASLRRQIMEGRFRSGRGRVEPYDHLPAYHQELAALFTFGRRLKVVVDCGNGVMGPVVLKALEAAGLESVPLFCEPDGDFPNHLPDPEVPACTQALSRAVVEHRADCGLGFDGDGDRLGLVDEAGRRLSADRVLCVLARDVLARHPGGRVRFDVKCSDLVAEDVRARGGEPEMGPTGHSLLKRDVVARDAVLGGELSGHFVFARDWLPIDDALYAGLSLLRVLDRAGCRTSELFQDLPATLSTAEVKLPCPDIHKFRVVGALVQELQREHQVLNVDGARVTLEPGTWFLVRASNTTPNLTVRLEARDQEGLERVRGMLLDHLRRHPEVDAGAL